ncbi:Putative TolA protein [hydrothermal vent metagenome]|uniref:Putative TolA protein n=1 Tax=hydrothermal vent metagenome TaxID=652676 RepID=A0A1W1CA25_9ZZZZ
MYYIENLNKKIIAADSDLLQLLGVETIEELTTKIAQNKIGIIEFDDGKLKISGENIDLSLKKKSTTIHTLFGDLRLIKFKASSEAKKDKVTDKIESLNMIEIPIIDEERSEKSTDIDSILIDDFKSSDNEEDTSYSFLLNDDTESEAEKLAKEAEAQRLAQEEAERLEREAEAKRIAEAARAAEAERERAAKEAEAQRLAQEEAERLEREAEAKRIAEAARAVEEAEAQKTKEKEDDSFDFLLDDDLFEKGDSTQEEQKEEEKSIETVDDTMDFLLDDDDSFIKSDEEIKESLSKADSVESVEDDTMDFLLDDDDSFIKSDEEIKESLLEDSESAKELVEEPELSLFEDNDSLQVEKQIEDTEKSVEVERERVVLKSADDIVIDSEALGAELGISASDYDEFLNEFADKAVEAEDSIRDKGSEAQKKAVSSLINLSQMLHLEDISTILGYIESQTGDIEDSAIETFYTVVTKLTTQATQAQDETEDEIEEEGIPEEESVAEQASDKKICDLNFDDVKPIHFDFQIEKAAEELSLPVDLIEEFVGDFILQAKEEKQTFIDACRAGDVDTIQKTGHKLKGVASNLRIVPLADTLEQVQFCEDNSRFESLLKKYWGQFLAFEAFINTILHNQGEN